MLQMLQARCVARGWITAALPLGERDDVGFGYIHSLIESFLISIYERAHSAYGEGTVITCFCMVVIASRGFLMPLRFVSLGGAKGGVFFTRRFAAGSGLNSSSLDFLPVANVEESELDAVVGGIVGAVPIGEFVLNGVSQVF